jgi:hypothetical protein
MRSIKPSLFKSPKDIFPLSNGTIFVGSLTKELSLVS